VPETRTTVTATVHAPAAVVFDLLATPHRHHQADASGMVGADEDDLPITKTGQVFRMNMTGNGDGRTVEYQTDNHVTAFTPNRAIGWAVAPSNGEPLGWTWRWDLEPDGDDRTTVSLTYDWTATSVENREKYGLPAFGVEELTASVKLLEAAVGDS
jgi:hypothetical protein